MIKRPLNPRFNQAVLDGRKFTTIRDKPWPVGNPIMLYNWSGAPYRSKHVDVAPVIVTGFWPTLITHLTDGSLSYDHGMEHPRTLWKPEGFANADEMDDWFRPLVKPNRTIVKFLHRFRLLPPELRPQR